MSSNTLCFFKGMFFDVSMDSNCFLQPFSQSLNMAKITYVDINNSIHFTSDSNPQKSAHNDKQKSK